MNDFDPELIKQLYQHNWSQNYGDNSAKETQEFWNSNAKSFAEKVHSTKDRQSSLDFLNRFSWSSDETVLDVAAGPGTYSIPLAGMVKYITVTDFSDCMLSELQERAKVENANNIETIQGRWLEIENIGKYDTVLCLNSLGVISADRERKSQLSETLIRLRNATKKRLIILIPHADSPLNSDIRSLLELSETSLEQRRVAALYMALVDNGILADLQILKRPFKWVFNSVEEAREILLRKSGLKSNKKHADRLDEYVKANNNSSDSGNVTLSWPVSQALYVWNK